MKMLFRRVTHMHIPLRGDLGQRMQRGNEPHYELTQGQRLIEERRDEVLKLFVLSIHSAFYIWVWRAVVMVTFSAMLYEGYIEHSFKRNYPRAPKWLFSPAWSASLPNPFVSSTWFGWPVSVLQKCRNECYMLIVDFIASRSPSWLSCLSWKVCESMGISTRRFFGKTRGA